VKLAILGAGAWGTAFALAQHGRHRAVLWTWQPAHCEAMRASRTNEFLPGHRLPDEMVVEHVLSAALDGTDLIIIATPTAALRSTLQSIAATGSMAPVLWLCKGFEPVTARFPHQVAGEVLAPTVRRGAISGPSFAEEIARGLPAAVTLASSDPVFADETARQLHSPRLRIYSTDDLPGVEVGGAVKNVMAIAAGICDGLGFGLSARAALMTRGLAEITRLGLKMGGRTETFLGLSGAGDLILTCTGDLSRNRRVGLGLAKGDSLQKILADLGHVAEGVGTAREARRLAATHGVEMPITEAVCRLLDGEIGAREAADQLLRRDQKSEIQG
jgi:glycerol-3-phosphate dehydrogenase (NAD(P)+)